MLLITALIGLAVSLYAQRYFAAHESERPLTPVLSPDEGEGGNAHRGNALHRERYFWPLFLFLWTALNALFLSADIFNLYVTLEMLGFAAHVTLVALARERAALTAPP